MLSNAARTAIPGRIMNPWLLAVLGALFGSGIYAAYRLEKTRIPQKQSRFNDRESLASEEIFERFYSSSGLPKDNVIRLWLCVAETLKLDAGKLRPTDSFDVELSPVDGFPTPDELNDLTDFYKSEWNKLGGVGDPPKIATLDEFIRVLSQK